jgi:hypothetical protein
MNCRLARRLGRNRFRFNLLYLYDSHGGLNFHFSRRLGGRRRADLRKIWLDFVDLPLLLDDLLYRWQRLDRPGLGRNRIHGLRIDLRSLGDLSPIGDLERGDIFALWHDFDRQRRGDGRQIVGWPRHSEDNSGVYEHNGAQRNRPKPNRRNSFEMTH